MQEYKVNIYDYSIDESSTLFEFIELSTELHDLFFIIRFTPNEVVSCVSNNSPNSLNSEYSLKLTTKKDTIILSFEKYMDYVFVMTHLNKNIGV